MARPAGTQRKYKKLRKNFKLKIKINNEKYNMKGIQPLLNNIIYFIEIPWSYLFGYLMKNILMSNEDKIKYLKNDVFKI